jgi:hypothetical protein
VNHSLGMEKSASEWKLPWDGGCRCGKVRLRVTQPPLLSMACHCTGCQRMSSSAFSLSLAVPTAGFELLSGEPVVGGLHGPSKHMFCGYCMTWMFTRPEGLDFFVNLRPSMLDDRSWFVPYIETYTDEKLPWATTSAVHSFAKLPEMSAFEGLIREFAAKGARPR